MFLDIIATLILSIMFVSELITIHEDKKNDVGCDFIIAVVFVGLVLLGIWN